MKKVNVLLVLVSLALFFSCSDTSLEPIESEEKIVFLFDFEDDSEGFIGHSTITGHPTNAPVTDAKDDMGSRCSRLYRAQKEDFSPWKGYDFNGNSTFFMGIDKGACEDPFKGIVATNFKLESDLIKEKSRVEFKYYMPDETTGLNLETNRLDVILERIDPNVPSFPERTIRFRPAVNSEGWIQFSENLPKDLIAGNYRLVVLMAGVVAIDDISLIIK
ncbi:hypothetical protein ACSIGC_11845 [Tenacibaculum sp. ZS6-P6]|uniref:hypothetical protein n=1 Tax=Tenacibaculum sp. ZS6-P6 TaxID=3447503 RepID=UPI003F9540EE